MLIDAAVQLCEQQGYEKTTVEQIAAAADVSPRTFSRYFATKDAVVLALMDDLSGVIATHLARQPAEINHLQALVSAYVDTVYASASARPGGFTTPRLVTTARIVMSSPGLRLASGAFRVHPVVETLAERMEVGYEDKALRLVVAVWTTILLLAFDDFGPGTDWQHVTIDVMVARVRESYKLFNEVCSVTG